MTFSPKACGLLLVVLAAVCIQLYDGKYWNLLKLRFNRTDAHNVCCLMCMLKPWWEREGRCCCVQLIDMHVVHWRQFVVVISVAHSHTFSSQPSSFQPGVIVKEPSSSLRKLYRISRSLRNPPIVITQKSCKSTEVPYITQNAPLWHQWHLHVMNQAPLC